jgi:hypothetical protein
MDEEFNRFVASLQMVHFSAFLLPVGRTLVLNHEGESQLRTVAAPSAHALYLDSGHLAGKLSFFSHNPSSEPSPGLHTWIAAMRPLVT